MNAIADDPLTEIFYRRLMNVADDFGRYNAHASLLRAALYPLRLAGVSDEDMTLHLNRCEVAGLVVLYESAGKPFLEIVNFNQRTRAKSSKFPGPDGQIAVIRPAPDGHMSGNCLTNDGQTSGTRRSHDRHMRTETEPETETEPRAFIDAYPRKTGTQIGIQTYLTVVQRGEHAAVMEGLDRWKKSEAWTNDGGRFIPEPGRWLTDRRWEERPAPAQSSNGYETPTFREAF